MIIAGLSQRVQFRKTIKSVYMTRETLRGRDREREGGLDGGGKKYLFQVCVCVFFLVISNVVNRQFLTACWAFVQLLCNFAGFIKSCAVYQFSLSDFRVKYIYINFSLLSIFFPIFFLQFTFL